jgi:NitT/TauT family transport system substrate-binding protein
MGSGNRLFDPNSGMQAQTPRNWERRDFVKGVAALAGASGLSAYDMRSAAAELPLETTRIRIDDPPVTCVAPQLVAEALLKAEGFTDIQYPKLDSTGGERAVGSGKVDIDLAAVGPLITSLDAGAPIVVLAGVHLGCYELFGTERVRAIRDLKGKTVPIDSVGGPQHVLLSSMAAYVGLDPRKDINWVVHPSEESMELLGEGKVDGFMAFPPEPQQLRAKKIAHVIVNTSTDAPWSQYYCCMLNVNRDFAQKYPVATKRAARAILKAADLCAEQLERMARLLVSKGFTQNYDFALETLKEVRYNAWRTYDPETTIRFHALRLHEVGMIKSSPQKLIAQGTDWRFLNELKRELKA